MTRGRAAPGAAISSGPVQRPTQLSGNRFGAASHSTSFRLSGSAAGGAAPPTRSISPFVRSHVTRRPRLRIDASLEVAALVGGGRGVSARPVAGPRIEPVDACAAPDRHARRAPRDDDVVDRPVVVGEEERLAGAALEVEARHAPGRDEHHGGRAGGARERERTRRGGREAGRGGGRPGRPPLEVRADREGVRPQRGGPCLSRRGERFAEDQELAAALPANCIVPRVRSGPAGSATSSRRTGTAAGSSVRPSSSRRRPAAPGPFEDRDQRRRRAADRPPDDAPDLGERDRLEPLVQQGEVPERPVPTRGPCDQHRRPRSPSPRGPRGGGRAEARPRAGAPWRRSSRRA